MASTLLDNENFKIISADWQIQDVDWIINGKKVSIKVKINPKGDVREYVSGVPASYIGQQLFTYAAALRETQKVGKSLSENQSALEAIIATMPGDTEIEQYKNYLQKSGMKFSGCFSSWLHVFDDIWVWAYYWLDDGSRLALNLTTRSIARRDESMWYMISLK